MKLKPALFTQRFLSLLCSSTLCTALQMSYSINEKLESVLIKQKFSDWLNISAL